MMWDLSAELPFEPSSFLFAGVLLGGQLTGS